MLLVPLLAGWYLAIYYQDDWRARGPWATQEQCAQVQAELATLADADDIGACFQPFQHG